MTHFDSVWQPPKISTVTCRVPSTPWVGYDPESCWPKVIPSAVRRTGINKTRSCYTDWLLSYFFSDIAEWRDCLLSYLQWHCRAKGLSLVLSSVTLQSERSVFYLIFIDIAERTECLLSYLQWHCRGNRYSAKTDTLLWFARNFSSFHNLPPKPPILRHIWTFALTFLPSHFLHHFPCIYIIIIIIIIHVFTAS
jgi:hypothetical protein